MSNEFEINYRAINYCTFTKTTGIQSLTRRINREMKYNEEENGEAIIKRYICILIRTV